MKKSQKKSTAKKTTPVKQLKKPVEKSLKKVPVAKKPKIPKKATPKAEEPALEQPKTESPQLLTTLRSVIAALNWEIHIPRTKEGEVVPYAIIGRPLFANLVKDHLEKANFNEALYRSFVK